MHKIGFKGFFKEADVFGAIMYFNLFELYFIIISKIFYLNLRDILIH